MVLADTHLDREHARGWVNVASLGFVGQSAAEDSRLIQRAIDFSASLTDPLLVLIPSTADDGASYSNPSNIPVLDLRWTVTASKVDVNGLHLRRIDNSPAVGNANLLNPWLAPMFRVDLISQSGAPTGSHCAGLFWMPSVKSKGTTTLTAAVVGSGVAQTVAVADSSIFAVGDVATVDLNQGAPTESLTITAVPDATHVTGVFTKNHANGARIQVNGKGDKIGLGVAVWDAEDHSNTSSIYAMNPNLIAYGPNVLQATAVEADVTNSTGVDGGAFVGDVTPWVVGMLLLSAGANDSSVGLSLGTASAARFKVGVAVESAKDFGVVVTDGPSVGPGTGLAVQSAINIGLAIGSKQTPATNPAFPLRDPTIAILLTAKGTAGNVDSGTLRFEILNAGVPHTFDLVAVTGGTFSIRVDGNEVAKLDGSGRGFFNGGLSPGTDGAVAQTGRIFQGAGVPNNANGSNGDAYFRTDTPGTANQRLYMKAAGAWVGIL